MSISFALPYHVVSALESLVKLLTTKDTANAQRPYFAIGSCKRFTHSRILRAVAGPNQ